MNLCILLWKGVLMRKNNDFFISDFLKNGTYVIKKDGSIWSYNNAQGHLTNVLRRIDRIKIPSKGSPYRIVKYLEKDLAVHRIIYAMYCGKLDEFKNVTHLDGDMQNNDYRNLKLVEQSDSALAAYTVYGREPVRNEKKIEKEKAIFFRKHGLSLKDIADSLEVAKSSVSVWTRNVKRKNSKI